MTKYFTTKAGLPAVAPLSSGAKAGPEAGVINLTYLIFTFLVMGILLTAPSFSSAQISSVSSGECSILGIKCGSGFATIASRLLGAINSALVLTATIVFAYIVYAGFLYVTSRGDEQLAAQGKKGIAYALIGLVIIGLAGWLVNAVINL